MVLPGSSIGRYLVKRKLAEGGMAELFLCTAVGPEGFEKEVVIKRIKPFLSSDPGFIDMFKAEARVASRLNHANVVQVFDFDKHEDAWFIAMEYVCGASLWELRRRCRELAVPFPPVLVAEIGAQVARGLHYAHTLLDKGKPLSVVHRDVTPHNVLLSFDGGVKLTDFGIAKAGTSFTAPGMLKGKFAYMSPEQARGEKVDARTDVFALGITLWEMLTGGRLFEGDSDVAVLRAVQESLIAPPARLNPEVPAELSEVVLKTLSRPLDQRFQSAHELDRALAHFVLKNSGSTDDSNVGLFLRQMFRDELEETNQELTVEPPLSGPDASQTPIVDAYALGNTRHFNRHHEPPTQQTATPVPEDTASLRPRTALMPGLRPSRPLPSLLDEDDLPSKRTDQLQEFAALPKEQTAQMPGLRPSRKLPPVVEPASVPEPIPPADVASELPKRGLLPWIIVACLSVGLIAGLGIAIQRAKPSLRPAKASIAIALPPVADRPSEQRPAELAVALTGETQPAAKPDELAKNAAPSAPGPAKADPPRADGPQADAPKPDAPKPDALKPDAPQADAPKPDAPKSAAGGPRAQPLVTPEPGTKPQPAVESARGFLHVIAIPYGTLFINNKPYGDVEGARKIALAPGNYALRLVHTQLVKHQAITIKAGQTVVMKFEPMPKSKPK